MVPNSDHMTYESKTCQIFFLWLVTYPNTGMTIFLLCYKPRALQITGLCHSSTNIAFWNIKPDILTICLIQSLHCRILCCVTALVNCDEQLKEAKKHTYEWGHAFTLVCMHICPSKERVLPCALRLQKLISVVSRILDNMRLDTLDWQYCMHYVLMHALKLK